MAYLCVQSYVLLAVLCDNVAALHHRALRLQSSKAEFNVVVGSRQYEELVEQAVTAAAAAAQQYGVGSVMNATGRICQRQHAKASLSCKLCHRADDCA
eukprot:802-Heterococcus_DN1.PRE.3